MKDEKERLDENIELLLQSAVRSEMANITPPPPDDLWIRIQKQAELSPGTLPASRRTVTKRGIVVVVTAASILFILGIAAPNGADAIGQRLLRTFKQLSGNVAQTLQSFDRRAPRNDEPPPPNSSLSARTNRRRVSLSEAQKELPFRLRLPDYLPAGYTLDEIILIDRGEGEADAVLRYVGTDGPISLTEVFVPDGWATGSSYDVEDTLMREIELGMNKAQLLIFKTGEARLTWIEGNVSFGLSGRVDANELIRIARSLK